MECQHIALGWKRRRNLHIDRNEHCLVELKRPSNSQHAGLSREMDVVITIELSIHIPLYTFIIPEHRIVCIVPSLARKALIIDRL